MTLRVPMIGYGFMEATHSVGWRQTPRMFDLPAAVEMTVVVGRNADAVAAAAETPRPPQRSVLAFPTSSPKTLSGG